MNLYAMGKSKPVFSNELGINLQYNIEGTITFSILFS